MLLTAVPDERQSWIVHTVYSLCIVENGCIQLPQGGPEMNTLWRKNVWEGIWLNSQGPSRYLISTENFVLCSGHGEL